MENMYHYSREIPTSEAIPCLDLLDIPVCDRNYSQSDLQHKKKIADTDNAYLEEWLQSSC